MSLQISSILVCAGIFLLQALVAVPWLRLVFGSPEFVAQPRSRSSSGQNLLTFALLGGLFVLVVPVVLIFTIQGKEALEIAGQVFAAAMQLSLMVDGFILLFALMLWLWPKGAAVGQAAFREGTRQPLFWLIFAIAFVLMTISPFVPYFTFGEDYAVVRELGYDTIMIAAVTFGALAASLSISEEIEGRTAVTLMSKPVSRRQFLLGKFAGILLASLLMIGLLGSWFEGVLLYKRWFDKLDPETPAAWVKATIEGLQVPGQAADFLRGLLLWCNHTLTTLPGLILNLTQVMVLVAMSVSLATRLPMVVNLSTILVVYFLGHLAPVLVAIGERAQARAPGTVSQMLSFMAQLFDNILPGLEFFRVGPALVTDIPMATPVFFEYVARVGFYGILYTMIVLLLGLILFEDRDLA